MNIQSSVFQLSVSLCLLGLSACGQDKQKDKGQDSAAQTTGSESADSTSEKTAPDGTASDSTPPGSVELGEPCKEDKDCKSNICMADSTGAQGEGAGEYKICGSCRDDAQCISEKRGLACRPSVLTGATECVDGKLGSPCEKKEHCSENLMCALVNMGDNKSEERSCSECEKHIDCPETGKRNCVSRDKPSENGEYYNLCLEDGVRQTGEICFPCETGNRECAEGFCVKVELEGAEDGFCIGVCGACHTDADCGNDSRCVPPELNFEGEGIAPHKGSKCVKKG